MVSCRDEKNDLKNVWWKSGPPRMRFMAGGVWVVHGAAWARYIQLRVSCRLGVEVYGAIIYGEMGRVPSCLESIARNCLALQLF